MLRLARVIVMSRFYGSLCSFITSFLFILMWLAGRPI